MFRFLKNILDTATKKADSTPLGIKSTFPEPNRGKREIKLTRALSRKATRMKLERILEKTEKRW
jgi:hypothetical protein